MKTLEKYDFKTVEQNALAYWKKEQTHAKAQAQAEKLGKGKKRYYFLDGPPYTSGKVHIGTAWNKSLKDMVLRYKRMTGTAVWDRAGYDMHGLPTAHAVQKKLKLETKEDIETYGVDKFVTECTKFCTTNLKIMNEDFVRLGVWMDFENAYQTIDERFMEGEWWLVKRAHEEKRLYEGLKTMTWCASCATALAKHECEYEEVTDESIFVKFPVKGEADTYLIIWTTTPWTIPFNLAIMVNPELDYQLLTVKEVKQADGKTTRDEHWIISKALAGAVVQGVMDYTFTVEKEFKGAELEGLHYIHPFHKELPHYAELELKHPKLHSVIMSAEYVDTSAGTGLVHCAPGCGPEDYEVGMKNDLPPFNTIDQYGIFPDDFGVFAGKKAKDDDKFFVEQLKKLGALLATNDVEHDYAHCWRCHNPVVFRTTKQWFFKVEDLKEKLIAENNKINWIPKAAYNAFDSWLRNLRDNSITKQRYWGTPLPVWRCDKCENYEVIGSRAELAKQVGADKLPKDLHKPWIDEVTWKCSCGGTKRRIPDVLDVWVDAGTTSWTCLNYPHEKELFDELFPADFILEGKDQIRGWFNLLHVNSMIAFGKPCFKACYMHGFVNDAQGRKMSKSLQNYILPSEVVEKYGADTLRYYTIGAANPAIDMSYNFDDVELKHRNLFVFWNLHKFFAELQQLNELTYESDGKNASKTKGASVEERYMLSRLNSTIKRVTTLFESYALNEIPNTIEQCLLDLSRTYIQLVREKASVGSPEEKTAVLNVGGQAYLKCLTMFAPISPFITEQIYQNLRAVEGNPFGLQQESIHLELWPAYDDALINTRLEQEMGAAQSVISAALAAREKANLGVRWPLATLTVETNDDAIKGAVEHLKELILQQTNIKELKIGKASTTYEIKPNFKEIGKAFGQQTPDAIAAIEKHKEMIAKGLAASEELFTFGEFEIKRSMLELSLKAQEGAQVAQFPGGVASINTLLTSELEAEGFMRELLRRVQQLRKEAGLTKNERIILVVAGEKKLLSRIATHDKYFQTKAGASKLVFADHLPNKIAQSKSLKVRGAEFTIGFDIEN